MYHHDSVPADSVPWQMVKDHKLVLVKVNHLECLKCRYIFFSIKNAEHVSYTVDDTKYKVLAISINIKFVQGVSKSMSQLCYREIKTKQKGQRLILNETNAYLFYSQNTFLKYQK